MERGKNLGEEVRGIWVIESSCAIDSGIGSSSARKVVHNCKPVWERMTPIDVMAIPRMGS